MKKYKAGFLIFAVLFAITASSAQERTVLLEYEKVKCIYNLKNGRLTGSYNSFYSNGRKRAEGKLDNGYRTGRWIVWDSTGRKRMERIYKNPFEYSRAFPEIPTEGPIPLLAENKYKLAYDSNGIMNYALMKAEDAIWRHKFWRYVEPGNNEILFTDNRLLKLITGLAQAGKIDLFDTVDDRFTRVIKKEKVFDHANAELIGFEIKEEGVFDMGRLVYEYRIVGLCPIVKTNNKIEKLFWVYYPDIRKYLGKENVSGNGISPNIKTLDDLFIFRDFSSTLIKTTIDNPYDKLIKDYPRISSKGILEEQEALELRIIEAENDIWISLTK